MAKKFSLKIINLVAVLAIVVAGIFGLSACSNWPWGEDTSSSDSRYDSLGRLRISSVGVNYNSVPANGNVDDNTGSFDWDLAYYFDVGKDYTYSNGTHYYGELDSGNIITSIGSDYVFLYANQQYHYSYGSTSIPYSVEKDGYYTISVSNVNDNIVVTPIYHQPTTEAYVNQMIGDVPNGTPLSSERLYKSNVIRNYGAQYNRPVFVFSSYVISVSGINYLIKVEVKNPGNLVIDYSNTKQLFSFKDASCTFANTFRLSYKVAGTEWIEITSDNYNMVQLENHDGRFVMRYFPKLDKGASTRYVQVKASTTEALENESAGDRATSALSGITTFKVYMLTFDVNVFSSTKTYEELTYDSKKYYFTSDSQSSANSALIGYFPEGKIVKVSRAISKSGDYAFQSWTSGSEATNSYVLANYMPNDHHGYPLTYTQNDGSGCSCLSDLQQYKGSYEVPIASNHLNISTNTAQESISNVAGYYKGTISVVSSSLTASHIFHANMAKVRNLVMAGNFVDAEKLTEEGSLANAKLKDVTIYVYQKKDADSDLLIGYFLEKENGLLFQSANTVITYNFDGRYYDGSFNISGFYWDYYLLFELSSTNGNYYTFYSDSSTMKKLDNTNQNSIRVLQFARPSNYSDTDDVITDTVQNTIIGTSQPSTEKVNVNLFVYRNGSVEDLDPNGTKIPYQVISTTTSEADALGYTTSKIIISLQLPSNYTLTSYTIETLNSIGQVLYTKDGSIDGDALEEYILCNVSYNHENQSQLNRYYYVRTKAIDPADITSNASLSYLYYGEDGATKELYQFSKRDSEVINDETIANYYYDLISNGEVLKTIRRAVGKFDGVETTLYTLFEYTPITVGRLGEDGLPDGSADAYLEQVEQDAEDPTTITLDYTIKYQDQNYSYADMSGSDIAIVANAYKVTDITYTPKDADGNPITDESGEPVQHDIYVYYDVKKYSYKVGEVIYDEYYYTAPIGKRVRKIQESESGDGNIVISSEPEPEIYFEAFDNRMFKVFDEALQQYKETSTLSRCVGSYIIEHADEYEYSHFISAIGGTAAIIADSYYYTSRVEGPTKLLISQYISSDADPKEKAIEVYIDPSTNKAYTGEISKEISSYSYQMSGRYFFYDTKELANVKLDYDANTHTYTYTDVHNESHDYVLSTSSSYFYLYSPLTYANGQFNSVLAQNRAIEGFDPNYISANIKPAKIANDGRTYFDERVKYPFGVDVETNVSMVYQFLIYANKIIKTDSNVTILNGDTINAEIYFDGSDFYYDTNIKIGIGDDAQSQIVYPVLEKLNVADGKVYYTWKINDAFSLSVPIIQKNGDNWQVLPESTGAKLTQNGTTTSISEITFYSYCNTRYFSVASGEVSDVDPTKLGTEYFPAVGIYDTVQNLFAPKIILNGSITMTANENYKYYMAAAPHTELTQQIGKVKLTQPKNTVVRRAKLNSNRSVDVHLVGKLVLITGDVIKYPVYDALMDTSYTSVLNDKETYYEVDYTTKDSVIQAFPGVTLISGAPYVNPILYYELVHKTGEQTELNVGLEIVDAFYVELISNAITSTEINLIYDFATVSFKDTITNLTQNDYIDRMYYVVFAQNLGTIVGYTATTDSTGRIIEMVPYLSGTPLTIQNIGLNDNDTRVYVSGDVTESGRYVTPLYYMVDKSDESTITIGGKFYKLLSTDDLVIWSSSATELENVPTYDIHSYNIADNGLVVLSSDGKENEICEKVDNLYINGTGATTDSYDYSEVLIGGTTSAYRVDASTFSDNFMSLQSFTWGSAINIANTYDATKAYFLCGKEGVVLVANPIVSIPNNGEDIIYRFKRWAVYSRYNSEVLYLNNEVVNAHPDVNNAVMRFTSPEAGYYVFMPIYERVYTINLATAIHDGAENLGGSINILYEVNPYTGNGAAINLNNSNYDNVAETEDDGKEAIDIYFIEFLKTELAGKEEYRYSNLSIETFLYFTGRIETSIYQDERGNNQEQTYPVFEKINVFKFGSTYFYLPDTGAGFKALRIIDTYIENQPGLIRVETKQTQYKFLYATSAKGVYAYKSYLGIDELPGMDGRLEDTLTYAYTVSYFTDGVTGESNPEGRLVYFDDEEQTFYAISAESLKDRLGSITKDNVKQTVLSLGEKFAVAKTQKFNAIAKETNDGYAYDYYLINNAGKISAGELYSYTQTITDENGNETEEEIVYTSLQFKTSYFERDTKIILTANPAIGYRLYGWYLAEYDAITGTWSASSTQLSELINTTYTDQILPVYYNEQIDAWYYTTSNRKLINNAYIYYIDEECTIPAKVADNLLDTVRGNYYKDNLGRWMPVYLNTENGLWYVDSTFSRAYTGNTADIEKVAHYDAVYKMSIEDGGETFATYYLGNSVVFVNGTTTYNIGDDETVTYVNYYRTMKDANMTIKDNKIWIENLHSNIRVVAKFIENYQSMIFTDDSSEDNIQVTAVYYDGVRTDDADNVILDAKVSGILMTDLNVANTKEQADAYQSPFDGDNYRYYHYYDSSYLAISQPDGILQGFNSSDNFYKVKKSSGSSLIDPRPEELILSNMHFDVGSDMYIVVKVHFDKKLNIHSLGLNTSNVLIPVLYPTDAFVSKNMSAKKEDRIEYYYYIFKVSFNRDMNIYNAASAIQVDGRDVAITNPKDNGSVNPEYLVHVNRGKAVVGDVLAGRNSALYSRLFDFYSASNNKMYDYQLIDSQNKVVLTPAYRTEILALLNSYGLTDTEGLLSKYYLNLYDFFTELHDEYHIVQSVDHVRVSNSFKSMDKYGERISERLKNADSIRAYNDILSIINVYLNGNAHNSMLTTGTTAFVNISSIPVYTYSTSIKLIDDTTKDSIQYKNVKQYAEQETGKYDIDLGVSFTQALYTRGGYLGQTYIGVAKQNSVDSDTNGVLYDKLRSTYSRKFEANVSGGLPDIFAEDYALAQNTVMVLGGISGISEENRHNNIYSVTADGITYVFKGWYEQKRLTSPEEDGPTPSNVWSDMQFMSADITLPFESTAYADTNIIALFERVVKLNFTFAKNSLSVNFNTIYDDIGEPIKIETEGEVTTISGSWSVTSLLQMDITPSGSYRFGSQILASKDDSSETQDVARTIIWSQENSSDSNLGNKNLVETITAEFDMPKLLRYIGGVNAKKVTLDFDTREIQLVYIAVDGYLSTGDDGKKQLSGPEFVIYKMQDDGKLLKILETRYISGKLYYIVDSRDYLKDSANRYMTVEIDPTNDQRLVMYGYYDKADYDGKLYIGYKESSSADATISAWYLNKYRTITSQDGIKTYKVDNHGIIETAEGFDPDNVEAEDLFRMCYFYTDDNVEILDGISSVNEINEHYFQGNPNNTTYLLTAKVSTPSNLSVGYATIDTLAGYDTSNQTFAGANLTNISKENNGNIAWTGQYCDDTPGSIYATMPNGARAFTDVAPGDYSPYPYKFGSDSSITLANELEFYVHTDTGTGETTYYKFIGWFKHIVDDSSSKYIMVSNSLTCSATGGEYYAIFAKVTKINSIVVQTINGESNVIAGAVNGLIDIVSNYSIVVVTTTEDSTSTKSYPIECFGEYNVSGTKFSYAIAGTNIKITATADQGYLVKDITPKNEASIEPAMKVTVGYTATNVEFDVVATLTRGVTTKVKHIYYDGIDMTSVGIEFIPSPTSYIVKVNGLPSYSDGKEVAQTFVTGTPLTFVATNSSALGLIGFYINGEKLTSGFVYDSTTKTYTITYTITDDITVEARYTNFITVSTGAYSKKEASDSTNGLADLDNPLDIPTSVKFNNYYTGAIVEEILITDGSVVGLLSGMSIELSTTLDPSIKNIAFLYWNSKTNLALASEQKNISNQATCKQLVEQLTDKDSSTSFSFYAIYQSAWIISIKKILNSVNAQDVDYYMGDTTASSLDINLAKDEFIAMLDVQITYTDINGEELTIILGTSISRDDIICKQGTIVTIDAHLAKSIESRYGYYLSYEKRGGVSGTKANEPIEFTANGEYSTSIEFYASRTLTIMRQVNNQPMTSGAVGLTANYGEGLTINDGTDRAIKTSIDIKRPIFAEIRQNAAYEFAGFYVNGIYLGRSKISGSGNPSLSIEYGEESIDTLNSYYRTTSTNITIVALWFARTEITTYVSLDDVPLSDSMYASGNNFADKLVMTIYGNRLTGLNAIHHNEGTDVSFDGSYNSTLQAYTTQSGVTEYIQSANNLALIASAESGFQFIGFYIKDVTTTTSDFNASYLVNENKKDSQVATGLSITFFGDALVSIIQGGELKLGHKYVIIARYATAYAITTQTTVVKQDSSEIGVYNYAILPIQSYTGTAYDAEYITIQEYDKGVISTQEAENLRNSSVVDSYYLPTYYDYVALTCTTRITDKVTDGTEKYTLDGFYINGVKLEHSIKSVYNIVRANTYSYYILNLHDYITKSPAGYLTTNNIIIEARYYETIDYIVRLGMNNTNDITKVQKSDLNNITINITTHNDHFVQEEYNLNLSLANNESGYWNETNNSLYYKLSLPIGTKITTQILGNTSGDIIIAGEPDSNGNYPYYYDGWYLYANQSVASSRTVINYTNVCEFTLSEDIDIVAQFYNTHESYTKDTQYSFRFIGEEFAENANGILYASEQNNNKAFATALKETLLSTNHNNEYHYTFVGTEDKIYLDDGHEIGTLKIDVDNTQVFTDPSGNNGNWLIYTIKADDGIAHKYLFTGWYQELKGGSKNKYMYITNELGLAYATGTMPHQMANAINLCAEFVEIVEINLNQSIANTVLINHVDTTYNKFIDNSALYSHRAVTEGSIITGGKDIVDILHAEVDNEMNYTIYTLYDSFYTYRYQTIQGYHGKTYDINLFLPAEGSPKYEITTTETTDENVEQYIEHLTGDRYVQKNKYTYVVIQEEMNVYSLKAKELADASTALSHASITEKGSASVIRTSLVDAKSANRVVVEDNDYLDFDETNFNNNKNSNIYGLINSANGAETDVVITVTMRLPSGTILTKILNASDRGSFPHSLTGRLNEQLLPIGTVISISVDCRGCRNELLTDINFFITDTVNFEPKAKDLDGNYKWLVPKESSPAYENNEYKTEFSYIVNDGVNLWFEFVFANVYPLSLTHNNTEQGTVAISYVGSTEISNTNSVYDVTIKANDYYSVNDVAIKIGEQVSYSSMFDIFRGITGTSTQNLAGLYAEMLETLPSIVDPEHPSQWNGWFATKESGIITLSYTYEGKIVALTITPTYSARDNTGRRYVKELALQFNLHAKTDIQIYYLHVTHVSTYAMVETYDANNMREHVSQVKLTTVLLYVYDYEFYTEESSHYAVINQLEEYYNQDSVKYNGQKLKSDAFFHEGYMYCASHLKDNSSDTGVLVINDGEQASNTIVIEAIFVTRFQISMQIAIKDYELGSLETDKTYLEFRVDGETKQTYVERTDIVPALPYGDTYTTHVNLNESINVSVLDGAGYFSFVGWEIWYDGLPIAISKNDDGSANTLTYEFTSILYDSNFVTSMISAFYTAKDLVVDHSAYAPYPTSIDVNSFTLKAIMQEQATELIVEYQYVGERFALRLHGESTINNIDPTGHAGTASGNTHAGGYAYAYKHYEDEENEIFKFVVAYAKSNSHARVEISAKEYASRPDSIVASTALLQNSNSLIRIKEEDSFASNKYLKFVGYIDNHGGNVAVSESSNILLCTNLVHSEIFKLATTNLYLVEMIRALDGLPTLYEPSKLIISANGKTREAQRFATGATGTVSSVDYAVNSVLIEEGTIIKVQSANAGDLDSSNPDNPHRFRGLAISNSLMVSDYLTALLSFDSQAYTYMIQKQYWFAALGLLPSDFDSDATDWSSIDFGSLTTDKIPENPYYKTLEAYSNSAISANADSFTFIANSNTGFISDNIGLFGYHTNYIATVFGADKTTEFTYLNNSHDRASSDNVYVGNNFVIRVGSKGDQIQIKFTAHYELYDETVTSRKYLEQRILNSYGYFTYFGRIIYAKKDSGKLKYVSGILPVEIHTDENGYLFVDESRVYYSLNNAIVQRNATGDSSTYLGIDAKYNNVTTKEAMTFNQQNCQVTVGIVNDKVVTFTATQANKYMNMTSANRLAEFVYEEYKHNNGYGYSEDYTEEERTKFIYGLLDAISASSSYLDKVYVKVGADGTRTSLAAGTTLTLKKGTKITLYAEKDEASVFYGFIIVSETTSLGINPGAGKGAQNLDTKYTMWTMKPLSAYTTVSYGDTQYYETTTNLPVNGNIQIIALYQPKVSIFNIIKRTYNESQVTIQSDKTINPRDCVEETIQGNVKAESLLIDSETHYLDLTILTNGFSEYKGAALNTTTPLGAVYYEGKPQDMPSKDSYAMQSAISYIDNVLENDLSREVNKPIDSYEGLTAGFITKDHLFTQKYSKQDSELQFEKNTNSISSLMIYWKDGATADATISVYFNPIYYTINLTLAEFETAQTSSDTGAVASPNAYIAYSDEKRAESGWANPTASQKISTIDGQILSELGITSTDPNMTIGDYFNIKQDDPYIYTWYDINGKRLSYPVRLSVNMIVLASSNVSAEEMQVLKLAGANDKNVITKVGDMDSTVMYSDFQQLYFDKKISGIYDYLIQHTKRYGGTTYGFRRDTFSIIINDQEINSGDLTMPSGYQVQEDENIYRYIFKNVGLGSDYAVADIYFEFDDASTYPSIMIKLKVFADANTGLPAIGIQGATKGTFAYSATATNSDALSSVVQFNRIGTEKDNGIEYTYGGETKTTGYSLYVFHTSPMGGSGAIEVSSGYNTVVQGNLFANAFGADEDGNFVLDSATYPLLEVNVMATYQRQSKLAEATLTVELGNESKETTNLIDLTKPNDSAQNNSTQTNLQLYNSSVDQYLRNIYRQYNSRDYNCDGNYDNFYYNGSFRNGGSQSEMMDLYGNFVDTYDMYVVNNINTYIHALEQAALNNFAYKSQIAVLVSELLTFSPAANVSLPEYLDHIKLSSADEYNVHTQIRARKDAYLAQMPQSGSVFDYINIDKREYINVLSRCGYKNLAYRLEHSDDLTFRRLNVLKNFKNSIDRNFFGTAISYNDGIVMCAKLTEHLAMHMVEYDWFGGIWDEPENGYIFLDHTTMDWGSYSNSDSNGLGYSSHFDNDYVNEVRTLSNSTEITNWQKVVNWCSGITNRGAKYSGTYSIFAHAGVVPSALDFTNATKITKFSCNTTVSTYKTSSYADVADDRLRTANVDQFHTSIGTIILQIVAGVALIIVGVACIMTGGILAAIIGAACIVVGTMVVAISVNDLIDAHNGRAYADQTLFGWIDQLDFSPNAN